MQNGLKFPEFKRKWDRRIDLKGATLINCIGDYAGRWFSFIKGKEGEILGTKGWFQDILFYITERLNMTIEIR